MSAPLQAWLDRAIESVARARAPKEPPRPAGSHEQKEPELERPSCPLCGATRAKTVLVGRDTWLQDKGGGRFSVVRCEVCSVRYTTPRFKREVRHLAFGAGYPYYLRAKEGAPIDRRSAEGPFLGRASRLAEHEPTSGRLLDLGCGDGWFMEVMRARGWDVVGADIEPSVVRYGSEVLGLDTRRIDFESEALPNGPFDAVTLWGSLQLAYRPQRLLERIREVMVPGGLLAIGVSNIKSMGAALFREHWHGLGLPRHLVHFTPETLRRLVEWSGFEVVAPAYETPRWITFGSVDGMGLGSSAKRRLVKAAASGVGVLSGRTRFADTMELYARARR